MEEEEWDEIDIDQLFAAAFPISECSIELYQERLAKVQKIEQKLRKQISSLQFSQDQFSMLINRSISSKYGPSSSDPLPMIKPAIPPLHEIDSSTHHEFFRLLPTFTPQSISDYVFSSGIIESELFSKTSIFDDQFISAISRLDPDVQISFITSTMESIIQAGQFYHTLLPLLNEFSKDSRLKACISNPNIDQSVFYDYLDSVTKTISEILHFEAAKICFLTNDGQSLIYPTANYSWSIDLQASLSGALFQNPTFIASPRTDQKFDALTENALFERDRPIYACSNDTVLIIFDCAKSNIIQQNRSKVLVKYFTPIFDLTRDVLMSLVPLHFTSLSKAVASLHSDLPLFESIDKSLCILIDATFCKILSCDEDSGVQFLPDDRSLCRSVLESQSAAVFNRPRMLSNFNRSIDDHLPLSMITSMLIVPIPSTTYVIALYNPTKSNVFTEIQKNIVSLFSQALPPLIKQFKMRQEISEMKKRKASQLECLRAAVDAVPIFVNAMNSDKFFNVIERYFSPCVAYYSLDEGENALKLPDNVVIEMPKLFHGIDQITILNEGFEELGLPNDTKNVFVSPAADATAYVCFFSKTATFSNSLESLEAHLSWIVSLLLPGYLAGVQLRTLEKRRGKTLDAAGLDMDVVSEIVQTKVTAQYFDPPLSEAPESDDQLTLSIETKVGVEAALTLDQVDDENLMNAVVAIGTYMNTCLVNKSDKGDTSNLLVSFFMENNALDVLGCTILEFSDWINDVWKLHKKPERLVDRLKFVKSFLELKRWSDWFCIEEKLAIYMIVVTDRICEKWQHIGSASHYEGLSKVACKFCSAIFFNDEVRKPELVDSVSEFAIGHEIKDESEILAHTRLASLRGFKFSPETKKWIGRAIILISEGHYLMADKFIPSEEIGNVELFRTERIFLTMVTFMAQRDEFLLQILTNTKNNLKAMHAIVKQ